MSKERARRRAEREAAAAAAAAAPAAAAALDTMLVKMVVPTAMTRTTSAALPVDSDRIAEEMMSPRPLLTTMTPRPTEPAMIARMFQFRARTAERGVSTPVTTIRVAPVTAISSMGARLSAAEVTTASRMSSAIQVLRVCGALPATFCHSPTSGLSASFSTERAVTRHISPGRAGASRSNLEV